MAVILLLGDERFVIVGEGHEPPETITGLLIARGSRPTSEKADVYAP